jgi:GxxExxY protein
MGVRWEKWGNGEMVKGEGLDHSLRERVIGCCISVHKALGPGFLESVYHRALEIELAEQGIEFETEKEINISYRGRFVGNHRLDFLVAGRLVLELKTVERITKDHYAQVRSYLSAIGETVGLLINFATMPIGIRRVELK